MQGCRITSRSFHRYVVTATGFALGALVSGCEPNGEPIVPSADEEVSEYTGGAPASSARASLRVGASNGASEIRIVGGLVDAASRSVELNVRFGEVLRRVRIEVTGEGEALGAGASIFSGSRREFSLSSTIDIAAGVHRLAEETPSDRLEMELAAVDEGHGIESYTWRGVTRSWVVPNEPGTIESSTLSDFRAFYPGGTTLENNVEGERLVALLESPELLAWADEFGGYGSQRMHQTVQDACKAAGACARLKCMAGGLANPLCHACVGIGVACAMYTIACVFGLC